VIRHDGTVFAIFFLQNRFFLVFHACEIFFSKNMREKFSAENRKARWRELSGEGEVSDCFDLFGVQFCLRLIGRCPPHN